MKKETKKKNTKPYQGVTNEEDKTMNKFYDNHPRIRLVTMTLSIPFILLAWIILRAPFVIWSQGLKFLAEDFRNEYVQPYKRGYKIAFNRVRELQ